MPLDLATCGGACTSYSLRATVMTHPMIME
uniref:Uncharacterized protein n=1 Tax=Anguilla anguilla TaxID=7936 RepID=A0A0E9SB21_ANGAN